MANTHLIFMVPKPQVRFFLCNLVDVYGMTEMQNAPGTVDEYPNWRVKLPVPVDDMSHQGDLKNFLHTLKRYR